jgi:hypothetical protein
LILLLENSKKGHYSSGSAETAVYPGKRVLHYLSLGCENMIDMSKLNMPYKIW